MVEGVVIGNLIEEVVVGVIAFKDLEIAYFINVPKFKNQPKFSKDKLITHIVIDENYRTKGNLFGLNDNGFDWYTVGWLRSDKIIWEAENLALVFGF